MNGRFRFGNSARLKSAAEFQRLKRSGRTFHGKLMILSVTRPPDAGDAVRLGLIASRKVGCAVVRNRIRRRLREIFRRSQHDLAAGTWIVVIARVHAGHAAYAHLEAEWLQLTARAGILHVPAEKQAEAEKG